MNTYTADVSVSQSLANLHELTEIHDSQGRVIGYFSPANDSTSALYAKAATHFDPEEMKRRKQSGETGIPTKDVIDRLHAMDDATKE